MAEGFQLTVDELLRTAGLSPNGPVPWGATVPEPMAGVYVVARVGGPKLNCEACALPFFDPFPRDINLDLECERQRWLPRESIVYVGKTDRPIQDRVDQFYSHKCGSTSPHAGGQVIKLLKCDLWVYWSPATNPYATEQGMIAAFKEQTDAEPFGNTSEKRAGGRIRRSI